MKPVPSLIVQFVLMAACWVALVGLVRGQQVTILHNFQDDSVANDGGTLYAGLIQGYDGNFYGTTYVGGTANLGTVLNGVKISVF